VIAFDERDGITELRFSGGRLYVPGRLRLGEARRIEILARDISLSLDAPHRTSILNVLPRGSKRCTTPSRSSRS